MRKDVGIVSGLYERAIDLSSSHPTANFAPYVFAKPRMASFSSGSSSLMPTIRRPLAAYFVWRSCSFGKDFLHGSQYVPQKSTSTTLPRMVLSATFPLAFACAATAKSGARFPTSPPAAAGVASPVADSAAPPPHAVTGAARTRASRIREGWVLMADLCRNPRADAAR